MLLKAFISVIEQDSNAWGSNESESKSNGVSKGSSKNDVDPVLQYPVIIAASGCGID